MVGGLIVNGMLTSELLLKTQLESDLAGARRIQQTLQPQSSITVPGYEIQTVYRPFRGVGGDYFDIVELPDNRTLFAMADVAGKGMPAALLAANVQALVRTIPTVDSHPLTLARQINQHLSRYTPDDRFVTALFIVLSHESGALTYVNAGHNAPIVSGTASTGSTMSLDATGMPLGLFRDAEYEARPVVPPGGALLLFTDGLARCDPRREPRSAHSRCRRRRADSQHRWADRTGRPAAERGRHHDRAGETLPGAAAGLTTRSAY